MGEFTLVEFIRSNWNGALEEFALVKLALRRDLLYKVIFQDPDHRNAVCWAEKYPETKEPDTLITFGSTQSQEIRPQGLDLGRSTSIRGCTSAQIKTLRPYFSIFSITVVRICLRKQQSKFFTNMLSTPSIEPVNIWFDSASPWENSWFYFLMSQTGLL